MTTCGVGAHDPTAIYIRPFCIDTASFTGDQTPSEGEMALRKSEHATFNLPGFERTT